MIKKFGELRILYSMILDFHRVTIFFFGFGGFLHCVQGEFTDDISETAVGPIFTGHELEHTLTHYHSKFTSHTVKKPPEPKNNII